MIKESNFCHLHLHDTHSLLDGYGSAAQYAARAVELGQTALSCTNHGNVDGLLKFQKACQKQGLTPILGSELYIVPDLRKKEDKKRWHMTVLIQNEMGFRNLLKMLSIANLDGLHYRPRVDPATVLEHREGLVFMSACLQSFINMPQGMDLLVELHRTNPVALEIMPHNIQGQAELNIAKHRIAYQLGIPLVATNDCHYPLSHQHQTQEVLLAIQRKAKWTDPDRWKFGFTGLHLRSAEEMIQAFREQGAVDDATVAYAMGQTMAFAGLCNYTIGRVPVELPMAHGYGDRDETELLWELVRKGWDQRCSNISMDFHMEYSDRIEEEMTLICQQGFQRYFLIVWEMIDWCHSKGILTGPGRGSVGGSLVAYLLHITGVDPIKYGLIFTRFISPERQDWPDIDMDFPKDRRDEVRKHLDECYGKYNVASISTFLTMKGKAALRDVGRVFGVDVDKGAKSIIDKPDGDPRAGHTIEDSLLQSEDLRKLNVEHPHVIQLARELEGQARGYGRHAAGCCISASDLRDGGHCYLATRDGSLTANWDKNDAEHMGLMKLDILGLSNLSVLNYCRELIKQSKGIDIEFDKIPLDDPKVFSEMTLGHSAGIFQMGTPLLIKLAKEMGVREFNDIVLLNALSRPGPLGSGLTDEFISRKKGQKQVIHIHPKLEPYTRDTLGMILFQEQVMWTMNKLASLSWGVCDKVRKVMGKSKGSEAFDKFKAQFVHGCTEQQTLSPNEAAHVWDTLASFGSYGFNLSHAVEYSMIGYWTGHLKFNYTLEFMAALLTHCDDKYKSAYVNEARRLGLTISLPRIGKSDASKWIPGNGDTLLAPFTEIKGFGMGAAQKVAFGKTGNAKAPTKKKTQAKTSISQTRGFGFGQETEQPIQAPAQRQGSAIDEMLRAVGADGRTMTEEDWQKAQQYFSFNIRDKVGRFKGLFELVPSLANVNEQDLLNCNISTSLLRIIRYVKKIEEFLPCDKCELRRECRGPVNSSMGRYNIMVVGEAPGKDEDQHAIGFIGKAGSDILWPELTRYGLSPLMFHVSNICKCYPGKVKTLGKKHIEACRPILEDEIAQVRPMVILAFGNTSNQFFRGQGSGISDLNGTTEWSDRYQCWVCWSLHPASVLHSGGNRVEFEKGIRNFAKVLGRLGGGRVKWNYGNAQGPCPCGGRWGVDNCNFAECETCGQWDQCAIAASQVDWAFYKNSGNRL